MHSEIHQIDHNDEVQFYFNSKFDRLTLLHNYTNANVYLTFPVSYGMSESEILLPGILVWGLESEEVLRGSKEDQMRDTFKTDETVRSRIVPTNYEFPILIDCEARHNELLAWMSQAVRIMTSKDFIWINGKKVDIQPDGASVYSDPIEGVNQIPKVQHKLRIEVKEETYPRETLVRTVTNTRNFEILSEPL